MSDTQSSNRNRRRKILINKPLQLKYTLFVVILIALYSVFLGYALHSSSRTTSRILLEFIDDNPALADKMKLVDNRAVTTTAIAMIINAMVITYIGIFSTHKVAGPLYRFKKHLESMKKGDFSVRTTLRKNDMLTDMANDFNDVSDSMLKLVHLDIEVSEDIVKQLHSLKDAIDQQTVSPDELSEALDKLSRTVENFVTEKKKSIHI